MVWAVWRQPPLTRIYIWNNILWKLSYWNILPIKKTIYFRLSKVPKWDVYLGWKIQIHVSLIYICLYTIHITVTDVTLPVNDHRNDFTPSLDCIWLLMIYYANILFYHIIKTDISFFRNCPFLKDYKKNCNERSSSGNGK